MMKLRILAILSALVVSSAMILSGGGIASAHPADPTNGPYVQCGFAGYDYCYYQKYSWSPRVYKYIVEHTIFGDTEDSFEAGYVSAAAYASAGKPPIAVVNYIPASALYKCASSPQIYLYLPDKADYSYLTYAKWKDLDLMAYTVNQNC